MKSVMKSGQKTKFGVMKVSQHVADVVKTHPFRDLISLFLGHTLDIT